MSNEREARYRAAVREQALDRFLSDALTPDARNWIAGFSARAAIQVADAEIDAERRSTLAECEALRSEQAEQVATITELRAEVERLIAAHQKQVRFATQNYDRWQAAEDALRSLRGRIEAVEGTFAPCPEHEAVVVGCDNCWAYAGQEEALGRARALAAAPAVSSGESGTGEACGSDGGFGIGAGHRCTCNRKAGHPLDSKRPHGCSCGAPWNRPDCGNAEADEGCAACGAAPAPVVAPSDTEGSEGR